MRGAPLVSWVFTVSCDVPPLEVVVVVDVELVAVVVVVVLVVGDVEALVTVVVVVVVACVVVVDEAVEVEDIVDEAVLVDVELVAVVVVVIIVVAAVVVVEVEVTQFMTAVRVVSLVTETALGLPVLPLSSQWSKEQEPYPLTRRLYDWPLLRVNVTGVNPLPTVTPFWVSTVL